MPYSPKFKMLIGVIHAHRDQVAAVVVHSNDTYLLDERRSGRLPGFRRLIATLRTLRKHVKEAVPAERFELAQGRFLGSFLESSNPTAKVIHFR